MAFELPAPQSGANLINDAMRQRIAILAQPTYDEQMAPHVLSLMGQIASRPSVDPGIGMKRSGNRAQDLAETSLLEDRAKQQEREKKADFEAISKYNGLSDAARELPENKVPVTAAMLRQGFHNLPELNDPIQEAMKKAVALQGIKPLSTSQANALTPDESKALLDAAHLHPERFPADIFKARGPQQKFIAQQVMADQEYDPRQFNINYAAGRTGAEATSRIQGGKGFEVASTVGSLEDILNQAKPLVEKMSPTSIAIANDAFQKGLAQTNNADANKILALMNTARGLYSQVITGGYAGTVESDKKANETIARGLNKSGFEGMQNAIMAEGYSRAARMTGLVKNNLNPPEGYIQLQQMPQMQGIQSVNQVPGPTQYGQIKTPAMADANPRLSTEEQMVKNASSLGVQPSIYGKYATPSTSAQTINGSISAQGDAVPGKILMVSPDGKTGYMPIQSIKKAIENGFKPVE